MEDKRTVGERTVVRGFASHRLEQALLALVYEHLWPVVVARTRLAAAATKPAREPQRANGG